AFALGPGIEDDGSRATPIATLPRRLTGEELGTQIGPCSLTGALNPGAKCTVPSCGETGGTSRRGAARLRRDGEGELRLVIPCWSAMLRSRASMRGAISMTCPP